MKITAKTLIAVCALCSFTVHATANDPSQASKFTACALEKATVEIKRAQASGEIPDNSDMFVAIEPYTDKAYAACGSLKPSGVTKPDGRPNDEIQDTINTALFDMLYSNAKK